MADQPALPRLTQPPPADAAVRVSFAALLCLAVDGQYILFNTGRVGPPGGAFQYLPSAASDLAEMGFQQERPNVSDLRGKLTGGALPTLLRWFATNAGVHREDGTTCLRRELGEELAEVGFGEFSSLTERMRFEMVRRIVEHRPATTPHHSHQLRQMEVYISTAGCDQNQRLVDRLVELAVDPAVTTVMAVTASDIEAGHSGSTRIAPHAAYLVGDRLFHANV